MTRSTAALAAAALLAAACAGTPGRGEDATRTIAIRMTDFAFAPTRIVVRPGEHVTLRFANDGTAEHEFMAGTGAMTGGYMSDWLAGAAASALPAADHAGHSGASVRVQAHGTASVSLIVPPLAGELEFACFVVGHYEQGMRGTIFVDAGRAPNAVPTAAAGTAAPFPSAAIPTMAHPSGDMGDEGH